MKQNPVKSLYVILLLTVSRSVVSHPSLMPSDIQDHIIFTAIAHDADVCHLQTILEREPTVIHVRDQRARNPLMCVIDCSGGYKFCAPKVYEKYMEMARLLLESGAHANKGTFLDAPLHSSIRNGDIDFMKLLLSHDANAEAAWVGLRRVSVCAPRYKHIALYLLLCGVSVDDQCAEMLEKKFGIPNWKRIQACAGQGMFNALSHTNFPRDLKCLLISFLSITWAKQFGVKIK